MLILWIRWHDFVRNTEVLVATNLSCIQDIITRRRNSLIGHIVKLDVRTPAHRALSHRVDATDLRCLRDLTTTTTLMIYLTFKSNIFKVDYSKKIKSPHKFNIGIMADAPGWLPPCAIYFR